MSLLKPLESRLEHYVVEWAKQRGIENVKLDKPGWPDREFFILGGRPALIEFKRAGEKPRPLQAHWIGILEELGYDVHVSSTKEDACNWLEGRIRAAVESQALAAARRRMATQTLNGRSVL